MEQLKFADNYGDLSRESGVEAGFQFEFYCERCNDTWRTPFVPYRSGQASSWFGKISGAFGGVLGNVEDTVESLARAGWGNAHDHAFAEAIEQAKGHFHRCGRCYQYVCDRCWNADCGLCLNCAPDAAAEIEAAKAQGMLYGAGEKAALEGIRRGKRMEVKGKRQMVCPQCGEATGGSKFCPHCGAKLATERKCAGCGAKLPQAAKFCPECGHQASA
jgi:hypothetical protein